MKTALVLLLSLAPLQDPEEPSLLEELWRIGDVDLVEVDRRELRDVVRKACERIRCAAATGERAWMPLLERIVDHHASTVGGTLSLEALSALHELGATEEYFLTILATRHDEPWLAFNVAWVVARDPTERTTRALEDVAGLLHGDMPVRPDLEQFLGAVVIAKNVFRRARRNEALHGVEARASDLFFDSLRGILDPWTGRESDRLGRISPRALWARRTLCELGEENPAAVCVALGGFELEERCLAQAIRVDGRCFRKPTEEERALLPDRIRDVIASFFGPRAGAEWTRQRFASSSSLPYPRPLAPEAANR